MSKNQFDNEVVIEKEGDSVTASKGSVIISRDVLTDEHIIIVGDSEVLLAGDDADDLVECLNKVQNR